MKNSGFFPINTTEIPLESELISLFDSVEARMSSDVLHSIIGKKRVYCKNCGSFDYWSLKDIKDFLDGIVEVDDNLAAPAVAHICLNCM